MEGLRDFVSSVDTWFVRLWYEEPIYNSFLKDGIHDGQGILDVKVGAIGATNGMGKV